MVKVRKKVAHFLKKLIFNFQGYEENTSGSKRQYQQPVMNIEHNQVYGHR